MIVYTGGTFDVPHAGHVNFFRQVKQLFPNCFLVVSLNTDEFVERFKGKKPLYSFDERKELISNVGYVDAIMANFGEEDSKPAILESKAEVVVIGSDWLTKDYLKQMSFDEPWLRKHKISLCYIPYTDIQSTSNIKERIKNAG